MVTRAYVDKMNLEEGSRVEVVFELDEYEGRKKVRGKFIGYYLGYGGIVDSPPRIKLTSDISVDENRALVYLSKDKEFALSIIQEISLLEKKVK